MMIHFKNACLTDGAMMSSLRLPIPTYHAIMIFVRRHHLGDWFGSTETSYHIARDVEDHHNVEQQCDYFLVLFIIHPIIHLLKTIEYFRGVSYIIH